MQSKYGIKKGLGFILGIVVGAIFMLSSPSLMGFFKRAPDVLWSGLISAVVAVLGVVFVDRNNTKRVKLQLNHQASESEKEHKSDLRRDVYLVAAEEVVKAMTYLGTMPNNDLTSTGTTSEIQGFASAMNKLLVVGDPDTCKAANHLVTEYALAVLQLMPRAFAIKSRQSSAGNLGDLLKREVQEVDRILASMAQVNESGKPNAEVFRALSESMKFHQQQRDKFIELQWQETQSEHVERVSYNEELAKCVKPLNKLQLELLICVRREVGLPTDKDQLLKDFEEREARIEAAARIMLANTMALIEPQDKLIQSGAKS